MATNSVTVVLDAVDNVSGVINGMMSGVGNAGKSMTNNVTKPLLGAGMSIAQVAGDFEASMNQVRVLTGATGDQFSVLEAQAKELGATTQFSASEAAEAMAFMGATGYDTNQIMNALPATLSLAAATTTDLGKTADAVTNIMQGYGLAAEESGYATDVLTKAFTSSNLGTDLSNLASSFAYVGPVAKGVGYEFADTAAAIGLLGNSGYQGSKAGTILRGAIANLANPVGQTAEAVERLGLVTTDSSGKMLPMADIIGQLEQKGATTADMLQLFGKVAGPGMQALLDQGSEAMRAYGEELEAAGGSGFAGDVAAVQMEGFNGAMKGMKSALEGLQIAIAQSGFLEFVTGIVGKGTGFLRWLTQLDPAVLRVVTVFAALAAAVGPILIGLGAAGGIIAGVGTALAFVGAIGLPVIAVIAGIAAVGALIAMNWGRIKETVQSVGNAMMTAFQPAIPAIQSFGASMLSIGMSVWQVVQGIWQVGMAIATVIAKLLGFSSAGQMAGAALRLFAANVVRGGVMIIQFSAGIARAIAALFQMGAAAAQAGAKIAQGISQGVQRAIAAARTMGPGIIGAIRAVASQAFAAGQQIMTRVADGIRAGIAAVRSAASSAASAIAGLMPGSPVKYGPLTVLNNTASNPGARIMEMLAAGMQSASGGFASALGLGGTLATPQATLPTSGSGTLATPQATLPTSGSGTLATPQATLPVSGGGSNNRSVTFAPVINIQGDTANPESLAQTVLAVLEEQFQQFEAGFLS